MKDKAPHIDFSEIKYLLTDSRNLHEASSTLFFCLEGRGRHGCDYVKELYAKGVRYFVVPSSFQSKLKANFIYCKSPLNFLQKLAAYHRSQYQGKTIAITGSNGKTVVKEWLFQLLNKENYCYRSPKSYNSQIGVPLSLWEIPLQSQYAIIEAGISMPQEMQNLATIIQPEIGIFTNLGQTHQENFKDLQEKALEKIKLFASCSTLIYCKDDALVDELIKQEHPKKNLVTWSMTDKKANYYINYHSHKQVLSIFQGKTSIASYFFPFSDAASIENICHCLVTALHLNYAPENIDLSKMESISMRLEQLQGINGCNLINDAYNSDVLSLGIALDALTQLAKAKGQTQTVFLSDIEQTGVDAVLLYREIAALLHHKKIDKLIAIGSQLSAFKDVFSIADQTFYASTADFLEHLDTSSFSQEAILFKGARSFEFESIIRHIEAKRHRTVMEIDMAGLRENINFFKSLLKPETKIMGMVKAFAYGSGYLEIARVLQQQGADYLAVAVADEGIDLRNHGLSLPIIVMTPERNSFEAMIRYQLEPTIYSFSELDNFIRIAQKKKTKAYPVHLKFDTGMHRLGFQLADTPRLIDTFKSQTALKVNSVYSHLAAADEPSWDDFTQQQIDLFETIAAQMEEGLSYTLIKHILNTAGCERFASHQNNMIRLGIGMYGLSANQNTLQQIITLKTAVTQIHQVPKNETVGYGRKGILKRTSSIATLPIGYADGIRRSLGNGHGYVIINGQKAPYIGNICMDLCMVDITGLNVQEGDDVILIGEALSPAVMAEQMGTIAYEVLTSISQRVKRIYIE